MTASTFVWLHSAAPVEEDGDEPQFGPERSLHGWTVTAADGTVVNGFERTREGAERAADVQADRMRSAA